VRVGFVIDWNIGISSLMVLARNMFRELGELMNEKQTFTVTAITQNLLGVGDINQHFDLIHFPNMGGYKFPKDSALQAKNIILSPSGIDEVVYGKEVFPDKNRWKIIEKDVKLEVPRWKQNMHKIKAVHVVSKSDLNEMNQYLGVPLDMMSVIHHGVNHDVFVAPNNKKEVQESVWKHFKLEKNNYFIHISEKNWARKNIPRLLDAFIEAKKSGLAQNLILVGKVHPLVIKKAKKIPSVKILGFISEKRLVQLIQGSDGLILPSIHEGFGLPLVEAMACGVPCITSNKHSPPEVVGDSGILVDPYNVTEISDAMIKLGKDEKLRSELSQKALVRSKDFSWKTNAASLLQLYEKSVPKITSWDFKKNFEVSARRTLATVCELYPHKSQRLLESLLTFDYSKMADWALKDGLSDEKTKDFLLPLEIWLRNKSENKVWK